MQWCIVATVPMLAWRVASTLYARVPWGHRDSRPFLQVWVPGWNIDIVAVAWNPAATRASRLRKGDLTADGLYRVALPVEATGLVVQNVLIDRLHLLDNRPVARTRGGLAGRYELASTALLPGA